MGEAPSTTGRFGSINGMMQPQQANCLFPVKIILQSTSYRMDSFLEYCFISPDLSGAFKHRNQWMQHGAAGQ